MSNQPQNPATHGSETPEERERRTQKVGGITVDDLKNTVKEATAEATEEIREELKDIDQRVTSIQAFEERPHTDYVRVPPEAVEEGIKHTAEDAGRGLVRFARKAVTGTVRFLVPTTKEELGSMVTGYFLGVVTGDALPDNLRDRLPHVGTRRDTMAVEIR